jgi:hypothetical protein
MNATPITRRARNRILHEGHAPPGTIYVCAACGRTGSVRRGIGDESCWLNAVLVYEKKNDDGSYRAVSEDERKALLDAVRAP